MKSTLILDGLMTLLLAATLAAQDSRVFRIGQGSATAVASETLVAFGARDDAAFEALLRGLESENLVVVMTTRRVAVVEVDAKMHEPLLRRIRAHDGSVFASAVHYLEGDRSPQARYIPTRDMVVTFAENTPREVVDTALATVGAEVTKILAWTSGAFVATVPKGADIFAACETLEARDNIVTARLDWLRYLGFRHTPNDPLFGNQWHLLNTGQGGGIPGFDIGATNAWNFSFGTGTTIAVIDSGVDISHNDINTTLLGYNPVTGESVTAGDDLGSHGTSCAGVAAAAGDNNNLVTGVAPQATVIPIRLLDGPGFGTPSEEASCFVYAADHGADVISNSWGPDGIPFPLPVIVEQSFRYATSSGRNGNGCVIFWAAGNGNENTASDGYVSSPYTVAVGAVTNFGLRAGYSDFGVAVDIVAPSSGGSRGIDTTIPGNRHTLTFGGTSAAAPQGAGVAALMLQVAPNIGWVQVRDILRSTADRIQPGLAAYDAQGHSQTYGYGMLDAEQAVLAAAALAQNPLTLSITTQGRGDINIALTNMGPLHEWLIGFSGQIFSPMGSGPLFGVGLDAFQTFAQPLGTIPFHHFADVQGNFFWSVVGVPPGITTQAVAIEVLPGFSFRSSNVVQVSF